MRDTMTRAGLLRLSAVAARAASGAGVLAAAATAATPPGSDLAYARLLVAPDLLGADFYTQATAAKAFGDRTTKALKRAAFNEQEHYANVAAVLTASGQTPATADDIDFSYPAKSFAGKGAIAKLGIELEELQLGAYLGAADAVQTDPLRSIVSRIAANEAQHLSLFTSLLDRRPFAISLPPPLTIDDASNMLGAYTS